MSAQKVPPYIEDAEIVRFVGATAAQRGKSYSRSGAVRDISWSLPPGEQDTWGRLSEHQRKARDPAQGGTVTDLEGEVSGSDPHSYYTHVTLRRAREASSVTPATWVPSASMCSCPVGFHCKHAAALMYASTASAVTMTLRPDRAPQHSAEYERQYQTHYWGQPRQNRPPGWREVLGGIAGPPVDTTRTDPLALGVELLTGFGGFGFSRWGATAVGLEELASGATVAVSLKPLRRGAKGNWIKGGLTWRRFQHPQSLYDVRSEHAELFSQIFRLHQVETSSFSGPAEVLRLDEFTGTGIWQLLSRARQLGIAFVGQGVIGQVEITSPARVHLDVRGPHTVENETLDPEDARNDLLISPVVERDGEALPSPRPAGSGGFLLVHLPDGGARRGRARLELVPAEDQVPAAVGTLLTSGEPLHVPRYEVNDFFYDLYPQLRTAVDVTSSDGSVDFPSVPEPSLRLEVQHLPENTVSLRWSWQYWAPRRELPLREGAAASGGSGRAGAGSGPGGGSGAEAGVVGRDLEHEDAVLASVREHWARAADYGLQQLAGADAARFVEHVLPEVETLDDVTVHEIGQRPDYEELQGAPQLRISQVPAGNARDNDWFDLGFEISIGDRLLPFPDVFAALARGQFSVLLPDKTYFSLDHPTFDRLRELLAEAEAMGEWEPESPQISRYQVSLWEDFEDLADETEEAVSWRQSVGALKELTEIPTPEVPDTLQADLRPYQLEGYAWLSFLHDQGLGGILADDMGLGKTVQTLAMIARARELAACRSAHDGDAVNTSGAATDHETNRVQGIPPFLVVAPSSVLAVWKSEVERFAPELNLRVLDTTSRKRGISVADAVTGADLVVTSYTLLRLDEDEYTDLDWDGLVLDEAQFVKNRAAKAHQAAKAVHAPFRVAITGTPMENSLTDLWALLSLTAPGLFASPTRFKAEYVKPIESPDDSEDGAHHADERMARLRKRVRPFMLRRTKDLVARDLPEKQEQVSRVPLHTKHRRLYDQVLQRERQKVLGLLADMDKNRFIVFRSLTLLRMLALDPAIVDEEHASVPSSKLESLMDNLEEIVSEGHRVIIFSQFTSFLARVGERLGLHGIDYSYLDGSTRNRTEVVEGFRQGEAPVFLISLKAGGFGLTLTEADYVFLLDPWWNPATEAQAVDRAHRIGQTKNVMVYRLVAEGTIEEKVLALQQKKAALFTSLTDGDSAFSQAITADDIRELLSAGGAG